MKIEIIEVDYQEDSDALTLRECGFQPGDIVEVSGKYNDGKLSIKVMRGTRFVRVGNEISIGKHEYKVVEG